MLLLRSIAILIVLLYVASGVKATAPSQVSDFSTYFPNVSLLPSHYLNGYNYVTSTPSWAVLWFSRLSANDKFNMYNSDPNSSSSTCHWDQFQWKSNALFYSRTRDLCTTDTDIIYTPGIEYLPRTWSGGYYSKTGTSSAVYYESGVLKCSGNNNWKVEIFADPVLLAPGVEATHVRNTQVTSWNSGPGSPTTGCGPGQTSQYQENLYFITDLPVNGTSQTAPGLKRTVGGSLDFYPIRGWDWDIWFDNWKPYTS